MEIQIGEKKVRLRFDYAALYEIEKAFGQPIITKVKNTGGLLGVVELAECIAAGASTDKKKVKVAHVLKWLDKSDSFIELSGEVLKTILEGMGVTGDDDEQPEDEQEEPADPLDLPTGDDS